MSIKSSKREESANISTPYNTSLLTTKVLLSITEVGSNIKTNLQKKIAKMIEGKCIVEGYIKPDSVEIVSYSGGIVRNGFIDFTVSYTCKVCIPTEGMKMECNCKSITKAGIHAEVKDSDGNIPITVFIAHDHHIDNHAYEQVTEGSMILVKIIGIRFELNDNTICAIAELL